MTNLESLMAGWAEKFRAHPDEAELPHHHEGCLGCGPDNPHGHHLSVRRHGDGVIATHTFDKRHVGAPGIAHGGALATVIDDLYGFLLYLTGGPAVTRTLEVNYLAPILLSVPYELTAEVTRRDGRKLFLSARVLDPAGRLVATSTALFLAVDVAHFEQGSAVLGEHEPPMGTA